MFTTVIAQRLWPWAIGAGLGLIFLVDLALGPRVAIWLLYPVLLLGASRLPQRSWPLLVALASTVLMVLVPLWSWATVGFQSADALNRGLGLLVLWAAALCQLLRRRGEEEQVRLLTELEQVYRTAPLGLALLSPELRFLRINERLAAWHGLPVAAHLGKKIHEVIPDLAGAVEELLRRVFATGEPVLEVEMQARVQTAPDHYRTGLVNFFPLKNPQGKVQAVGVFVQDITERKEMEAALKENEELYRTLFETSPDAIGLMDLDAKIIKVNQQSRALFGYGPDEDLRGKDGLGYVAPEDRARIMPYLESLKATGTVGTIEMLSQKKDGSRVPIEATARFLLDAQGQPKMLVGFCRDISARKQGEMEREQLYQQVRDHREQLRSLSRRLMEAQEAERRFLASELHDEIGQVLTAVSLNLEAAKTVAGPAAAPQLQEGLHTVNRALQQVRDLSLDLRPAMLDLLGLEAALRWYADRQAQRAGFTFQLASNLGQQRLATELETAGFRVAQESLTNVVRHARAQHVDIELQMTESTLHMTIRDDGIGFDLARQRQQAAAGQSLGLFGMQERVHLLGGRIDVHSQPGQGTRVEVYLPLNDLPPLTGPQGQDSA